MQSEKRSSRRGTFLSQDEQRMKTQKQPTQTIQNINKNMQFKVLSPKHIVTQEYAYPTKFTMKIKKDKQKPATSIKSIDEFHWQKQRQFYQRQLRRLRQKFKEISNQTQKDKKQLKEKDSKIAKMNMLLEQYQQCNEGLVKESEENIKKFEQYMKDSNNQKQKQIYQLNIQITDLKKQLYDKDHLISQYYREIHKIKEENRRFQEQLLDTAGKYYSSPPNRSALIDFMELQSKSKLSHDKYQQQINKMQVVLAEKQKYIIKLSQFNNQLIEKMLKQKNELFETSSANMNEIIGVLKSRNQQKSKFRRVKSEANILAQELQPQCYTNQNQLFKLKNQIYNLNQQLTQRSQQTKSLKHKRQSLYQLVREKEAKIQELTYLLEMYDNKNSNQQNRNYIHLQQIIKFKDKLMEGLSAENQQLKIQIKKANQRKSEGIQFSTNQSFNIALQTQKNKTLLLKDALQAQESLNKALRQRLKAFENKGNINSTNFSFKYQSIQEKIERLYSMYKQLNVQMYECILQIIGKKGNVLACKSMEFDSDLITRVLSIIKLQIADSQYLQREILEKLESGIIFKSKSTSKLGNSKNDFDMKFSLDYQSENQKKNQRSMTALNSIYISNSPVQGYSRMKQDII